MSSGREYHLPELQIKKNESRLSVGLSFQHVNVNIFWLRFRFLAIKSPMTIFFWRSQNPCFQIHCQFLLSTKIATAEHINQTMIINRPFA